MNVLGTSRINLPGMSLERQIKMSPGRHFRTSDWDIRPLRPRDDQIGSLRYVLGTLEWDVLGKSWRPILACWVVIILIPSVIRQKGESQNGCFKKTRHAKFSKKTNIFYPLIRFSEI